MVARKILKEEGYCALQRVGDVETKLGEREIDKELR